MTLLLRAEGLAYALVGIWSYAVLGLSWFLFAALFLVPDLSFAAYLAGPRWGAIGYNAAHTNLAPLALASIAYAMGNNFLLACSAIWLFHIGFDRILGYGLKSASSFHDTHLGRIGSGGQSKN